ncbi:hypothetical protein ACR6C2_00390 [Streptomyces sp. INA 01156]
MPDQHGIDAYAAYLPAYALNSNSLEGAPPAHPGPVRSVAGFDEDAVTMAVEALRHIVGGTATGHQLLLATTSAPYEAKTAAGIVHEALGLDPGAAAVDLRGHRSGASALDLVTRTGACAAMADIRFTRPGAPDELAQGDAGAAFVGGRRAAVLLSRAGRTTELLERWRLPGEQHDRVWDEVHRRHPQSRRRPGGQACPGRRRTGHRRPCCRVIVQRPCRGRRSQGPGRLGGGCQDRARDRLHRRRTPRSPAGRGPRRGAAGSDRPAGLGHRRCGRVCVPRR